MARPRKFVTDLTQEDRTYLESIVRTRSAEQRFVTRAKVILACADGKTNDTIAKELGLSKPTVINTLKKWVSLGVHEALKDLQRPGKPKVITMNAQSWVISLACSKPEDLPMAPKTQQWTITSLTNYVKQHCLEEGFMELENVQRSTIWNILNDRDIKPHRIKYYLERKDPEFKPKAEKVLLVYKRIEWILQMTSEDVKQGESVANLCGEVFISYDEKPGIQAIKNIAPDLRPAEGKGYMSRDYEYKRLGTVSLLAGIDLLNGEVTGLVRDTHTSTDFIDFLENLDSKYDASLTINIILDNHSVHRSKAVLDYLTSKPKERFKFTFTPKHASWLNLVESFFSKFARQALRNLRVNSKEDLKERIENWIKQTNEERVIYRWTWKLDDIESAFTGS